MVRQRERVTPELTWTLPCPLPRRGSRVASLPPRPPGRLGRPLPPLLPLPRTRRLLPLLLRARTAGRPRAYTRGPRPRVPRTGGTTADCPYRPSDAFPE